MNHHGVLEKVKQQIQLMALFPVTPVALRKRVCNPLDPLCPFHGYEGNEEAVTTAISLTKQSFNAMVDVEDGCNQPWKLCNRQYPVRMLLTGPRSVGKTTFARNFAAIVSTNWDKINEIVDYSDPQWKLPWIEIDGSAIKKREEIFSALEMGCRAKGLPMIPIRVAGGVRHYQLPPLFLFIDEIHAIPKQLKEGILKMTERNDGILEIGVSVKIDCRFITIISATTNPGLLQDTLMSRFPVRLDLRQHTLEQVAKIIQNAHGWPIEECLQLAEMKPLPREALAVAQLIEDSCQEDKSITLQASMTQWIDNLSLREGGLTDRAVEVLVSLAEAQPHGMSKENLCVSLAMGKEEFQRQLLPQLLRTPTHSAFVTVSGRHKITLAGLEELRCRGCTDY